MEKFLLLVGFCILLFATGLRAEDYHALGTPQGLLAPALSPAMLPFSLILVMAALAFTLFTWLKRT